ncbi:AraC family transcriptional regulator [Paenibacillus lycopersici]|uniref:AraC family transcriptional regulator n=1 Tax=Paenibacillus lycopersici TaxID=2704462 RepID=A0A6C0FZM6_9BACL|nr:AraC family transcriptional regulator [Paenibacillus lycopersici]QHT62556.1 AraC family transcriptional regulator [Paenibacillus lycopersici]
MSDNQNEMNRIGENLLDSLWFKLLRIEKVVFDGDEWKFERERIERHRLIVCADDTCRVVVDGVRIAVVPGSVVVCIPGQWIETGGPSKAEQTMYIVDYERGYWDRRTAETDPNGKAGCESGTREYRLASAVRMGETMHRYWERFDTAERMRAQAVFHELLAGIAEKRERPDADAPDLVKEAIDRRYGEELSIEELAELSGVNRYHLMRSFKERYGKSIIEYITEVRLLQAKRLMLESSLPIAEIAGRVGFRSEAYFRTVFKKEVEITPAVYLRNRRRKVAAYSWPVFGQLLPLNVIPHAAPIDHYWTDEFSRKYGGDVTVPLGHDYEFNRSALRRARPDCIIGLDSTISREEADRLGEIAPVLLLPWMKTDWRSHLRMVGDFLGMAEDAEMWLERYEWKAASVRERISRFVRDDKVLVLKVAGDELQIWGCKAMSVLYDDLGLAPAALAEGVDWYKPIELERLSECDAGRFVVSVNGDVRSQAFWEKLQADKNWRGLKQVREQAVHSLRGHSAWVHPWIEHSAFYQERLLDGAAHLFL